MRQINFHGLNKIICKLYDNGYCRYQEQCKYHHTEENCNQQKCENVNCQKRHPKPCRFYRRNRCNYNNNCKFSHEKSIFEIVKDSESLKLKEKIRAIEETNLKSQKESELNRSALEELKIFRLP